MSEINKAEIRIGFVVFADSTGWSGGNFLKQDATTLGDTFQSTINLSNEP